MLVRGHGGARASARAVRRRVNWFHAGGSQLGVLGVRSDRMGRAPIDVFVLSVPSV